MNLLTPEQLANFAKKYNRLVANLLLIAFCCVLQVFCDIQGSNNISDILYKGIEFLFVGLNILLWFLVFDVSECSFSPAIQKYPKYFLLFSIIGLMLLLTPFTDYSAIIGLLAFYVIIRLLSHCEKRFKEHHVRIGMFASQKNLKTALFSEEEIQNAEILPRRTWGVWLLTRASLFLLGLMFVSDCIGIIGNWLPQDATFQLIQYEAKEGNAEAQYRLGNEYFLGKMVEKDDEAAFFWFQKSAEGGFVPGMYNLALCYRDGIGTAVNLVESHRYCRMAAEQNHAIAQYILGTQMMTGTGTEPNEAEAVQWFQKSMEQNYPPAIYAVGYCQCNGIGIPKDEEKGKELIQKAADMGYSP